MNNISMEQSAKQSVAAKIFYFPLTRILLSLAVILAIQLALRLALEPVFSGWLQWPENFSRLVRFTISLPVLMLSYYYLFRFYEKRTIPELKFAKLPMESGLGVASSVASLSLILLVISLLGGFEIISANNNIVSVLPVFLVILYLAALEEIMFRGILYRIIEQSLGTNLALVISGLFFGFAHAANPNAEWTSIFNIALAGILLGLMYSYFRSLWFVTFFHAGWNFTQVFFGCPLSGTEDFMKYAYFNSQQTGNDLISGGAFGPENSVIALIFIFLLSMYFYRGTIQKKENILPFWKREKEVPPEDQNPVAS